MRKKSCPIVIGILLVFISLWLPFSSAQAQLTEGDSGVMRTPSQFTPSDTPKYASDRVIVKYKSGKSKQALAAKVAERAIQTKNPIGFIIQKSGDFFTSTLGGQPLPEVQLKEIENVENRLSVETKLLSITDKRSELTIAQNVNNEPINVKKAVEAFESLDEVEYAEPVYLRTSDYSPNDQGWQYKDPYYGEPYQWGLKRIQADLAWDITQGDPNGNILIAVIDSGISADHPDISSKVWARYDCRSDNGCTSGGVDIDSHGTHVGGIAGALTNNNDGVAGTGFNTKLISLLAGYRAWDVQIEDYVVYFPIDWEINALNQLLSIKNANPEKKIIVNMSFGGSYSITEADKLAEAWNQGLLLVASVGNNNSSIREYPAAFTNVIAVGATKRNNSKASYSNYGASWVNIAAPGGDDCPSFDFRYNCILSTYHSPEFGVGYSWWAGTSMAAPFVSGTAALVWSANPNLSNSQVRQAIENTADNTPGTGVYWAHGRINAYRAVQSVIQTATLTPSTTAVPTITPTATLLPTPTLTPTITPTPTLLPPYPTPTPKAGDLDGDGNINIKDLINWRFLWANADPLADVNNDGQINLLDYLEVLILILTG